VTTKIGVCSAVHDYCMMTHMSLKKSVLSVANYKSLGTMNVLLLVPIAVWFPVQLLPTYLII